MNLLGSCKRILLPGLAVIVVITMTPYRSCGQQAAARDLSETVTGLTPDGWQIFGAVKQFGKENVWEQINGRASFFLAYDMLRMTHVSFVNGSNESQFIDLSIYDMGTATHAFGVFSSERSPEAPSIDLGRAGYRSDANYFIWKGRYYIRIISSDVSQAFQRTAMALARRVEGSLTDSGEPVWGLTALPAADRIPQSVRYIKNNAMGLEFMRNTYTAEYRKGNSAVTAFVSRHNTTESAEATVARFAGYVKNFGESIEAVTVAQANLVVCDMGGSFDVVFTKGRLVGGVSSVENRNLALKSAIELWKQLPQDNQ
jgi:hypothetical protein